LASTDGVDPKAVEITADQGVLTIRGQREDARREAREGYRRVERIKGEFQRRSNSPDSADAENIKAFRQRCAASRNSEISPSATAPDHGGSRLRGSAGRDLPCNIATRPWARSLSE
jgi:hypothetical protein